MNAEYRSLLQRAADDPAVRVIVVTGAGRGFCAGADADDLAGHAERGSYDAGAPDDLAMPGLRRPPGVRRRARLPLRRAEAHHRRRQRAGGRHRFRPRLLLRSAHRGCGGDAHHRPRSARAPLPLRAGLVAAPSHRVGAGPRPHPHQPQSERSRGPGHGAGQPGLSRPGADRGGRRLRPTPGHHGLARLARRIQAAGLRGDASERWRRRCGRPRPCSTP